MINRVIKEFVRGHLPSVLLPSFSIETLPGKRISCAPVETRFSEILNDEKPNKDPITATHTQLIQRPE